MPGSGRAEEALLTQGNLIQVQTRSAVDPCIHDIRDEDWMQGDSMG